MAYADDIDAVRQATKQIQRPRDHSSTRRRKMNSLYTRTGVVATVTLTLLAGCSSDPTGPEYNPEIPAGWASSVTNQFYPLTPGTTYQYEGETTEGVETITIEVLEVTGTVNGVVATVVRDRASLDGELIEDTEDWFAQDLDGECRYLGEDTKEYENGQVVSTEGSWEWGSGRSPAGDRDVGRPQRTPGRGIPAGILRRRSRGSRQSHRHGRQRDRPQGSFTGCIQTED